MADITGDKLGDEFVDESTKASWAHRFFDSDIWYSFRKSKITMIAAAVTALYFLTALFAPIVAPSNPYDLAALELMDAFTPPSWAEGGNPAFLIGADDQGRDLLSAIIYGARVSLLVGFASTLFAMVLGVTIGMIAGFRGGATDAVLMRIADIQLSFPAILVALLIDGVVRSVVPSNLHGNITIWVLIFSIGISSWVNFARTVRGSCMVERGKEYVQAARVIGIGGTAIMIRHLLPNVMGPVMVIATIQLAVAVLLEATLSFLGVGMPATQPSLGTLINTGQNFLYSGEWWITVFPGAALAVLVLSVNLVGDWARDAFNPKLR
jgi:peptide/nickel transport system permease protein